MTDGDDINRMTLTNVDNINRSFQILTFSLFLFPLFSFLRCNCSLLSLLSSPFAIILSPSPLLCSFLAPSFIFLLAIIVALLHSRLVLPFAFPCIIPFLFPDVCLSFFLSLSMGHLNARLPIVHKANST